MRARFRRRLRGFATIITSFCGEVECGLGERGSALDVEKEVKELSR